MKTLVVILNYNMPSLTDQLYRSLKPYEGELYDVHVLDNCSPVGGKSKYTTLESGQNCYFGGAINLAFQLFKDETQYDSLMFLNNDVILHGYNYVKTFRELLFKNPDYAILSPCMLQPEENQCFWRQMHCYNSNVIRDVKWVDFFAPIFDRKILDYIEQFPNDLVYGWGQDVLSGIICEENNLKVGVVDWCPVIHMSSLTFRDGKGGVSHSEYSINAERQMMTYFSQSPYLEKFNQFRQWGRNYKQ